MCVFLYILFVFIFCLLFVSFLFLLLSFTKLRTNKGRQMRREWAGILASALHFPPFWCPENIQMYTYIYTYLWMGLAPYNALAPGQKTLHSTGSPLAVTKFNMNDVYIALGRHRRCPMRYFIWTMSISYWVATSGAPYTECL